MTPSITIEEQKWWDEDAERHNALCEQAQKLGIIAGGKPSISPPLKEDGSLADSADNS